MSRKVILIVLVSVVALACTPVLKSDEAKAETNYGEKKAASYVTEARQFCKTNNFNQDFCILIDMSLHSGFRRLFIWDFGKNSPVLKAMVSHGCGKSGWAADDSKESPVFSNEPESHCSSPGKYKIGQRGYSQWGIGVKYLLHGLESTNNNALKRNIVLHSWEYIPDEETYPAGIAESWGCPAVSNACMQQLDGLLKTQSKPTLLWVIY